MTKIVFQGDSVTDCGRSRDENLPLGAGLGSGYASLVSARLLADRPDIDWQFVNSGISGNRVVDLYARWKKDALNLKPDILSILVGVNDTWHEFNCQNGVEVDRYARIYRELLEWTKAALPNVKLVLMQPFVHPFGAVAQEWLNEMKERGEVVRNLAADFNAVYIPCQEILDEALNRAPAEYWTLDGVHPTLAGHQLLADKWLQAVKI